MVLPTGIGILGVNMVFVAFVLYIIALNIQEKVGAKETASMCILVGSLNAVSALYNGFILGDTGTMAAQLLFSFTYFFFAMDLLWKSDTTTGLGNYALCVTITTIPYIGVSFYNGTYILGSVWVLWGALWLCFWIANGLQKDISKFLAPFTIFGAICNFVVGIGFLFGWLQF